MSDIDRLPEPDRPKPPEVVYIDVNFQDVIHQTETDQIDIGLMAIENTVAGSILSNYRLLSNSSLVEKFAKPGIPPRCAQLP